MKVFILLALVSAMKTAESTEDKMKFCGSRLTSTTCLFCWVRKLVAGQCEPPTTTVTNCVSYDGVTGACTGCEQG